MNKSSFPIILPPASHDSRRITGRVLITQVNAESLESRDDTDTGIGEAQNSLFLRASSLSFPIDHYCMMVEKVYISFLKSLKRYSASPTDKNNTLRMEVYVLGKRLQLFLKDVLPLHMHYFTEFKGRERIKTISSKVDEYLNNLITDLDVDTISFWDGNYNDEREDACPCDFSDRSSHFENEVELVWSRDKEDNEIELTQAMKSMDETVSTDKSDNFASGGSSTSTSYSCMDEIDWDDCEYNKGIDGDGFILTVRKTEEEMEQPSKRYEKPDFPFRELISHWRALEKNLTT